MKLAKNKALLVESQACLTPTPGSSHCALWRKKHEQVNKTTLGGEVSTAPGYEKTVWPGLLS